MQPIHPAMQRRATAPYVGSAFADWLRDERGLASQTRRSRLITIRHAQGWLRDERHATLLSATQADCYAYLALAKNPRTRNRRLVDLRSFYRFVLERRMRRDNPLAAIERVREPKLLPRPIPHDQAMQLLHAAFLRSPRAYTATALFLYTGMRRSEVANLAWSDIDLTGREIRVLGKGSKERVVPISSRLGPLLVFWHQMDGQGSGWVFPSPLHPGRALSAQVIYQEVKRSAIDAGMVTSLHRLRHTFATELLREGIDVRYVQQLLGHARLDTTAIYTEVTTRDLGPAVEVLDFASGSRTAAAAALLTAERLRLDLPMASGAP